jgi:hypothetical protein
MVETETSREAHSGIGCAAVLSVLAIGAGFAATFLVGEYSSPDGYGSGTEVFVLLGTFVVAIGFAFWLAVRYNWKALPIVALDAMVFIILLAIIGPSLLRNLGRKSVFQANCTNNLRQIGLALRNYHDVYGSFPPAYVADASGRPMHSWRVLILPYLEHRDIVRQYRVTDPWDSPANQEVARLVLSVYTCPSNRKRDPPETTSYVAVVGPRTAWPGTQGSKLADFTDGPENTVLLVEMAGSGIRWSEPRDLCVAQMVARLNPPSGVGPSSRHVPRGVNVLFADGTVRSLRDLPPEVIYALLSRDGGEKVDPKEQENVFPPNNF